MTAVPTCNGMRSPTRVASAKAAYDSCAGRGVTIAATEHRAWRRVSAGRVAHMLRADDDGAGADRETAGDEPLQRAGREHTSRPGAGHEPRGSRSFATAGREHRRGGGDDTPTGRARDLGREVARGPVPTGHRCLGDDLDARAQRARSVQARAYAGPRITRCRSRSPYPV